MKRYRYLANIAYLSTLLCVALALGDANAADREKGQRGGLRRRPPAPASEHRLTRRIANPFEHAALLLIDLQNDFMPGGSLAVPGGNEIVPLANRLMSKFPVVVASKDWHPGNHISFASRHGKSPFTSIRLEFGEQKLWPDHCVRETPGAEFHRDLNRNGLQYIVYKGKNSEMDSYSAFYDNWRHHRTDLTDYLHDRRAKIVYGMGLVTEVCDLFTMLDGVDEGFEMNLILPGCRAVNINPGDGDRAVEKMRRHGVKIIEDLSIFDVAL